MGIKKILLYIRSPAKLSQYRGRVRVTRFLPNGATESKTYPLHSLEAIIIANKQVSLTGGFLELVITSGIPVLFLRGNDFATVVSSRSRDKSLLKRYLRRLQDRSFRLETARELVLKRMDALEAIASEYLDPEFSYYSERNLAYAASSLEDLRLQEAQATRKFYRRLSKFCSERDLRFDGRHRHPPSDVVNALLSYGNALVYSRIFRMLISMGFDPFYGILHRDSPMALAFDISDPYKPLIVERTVIRMIRLLDVREELFSPDQGLDPELKRKFVRNIYEALEDLGSMIEDTIRSLRYAVEHFPKVHFEVKLREKL